MAHVVIICASTGGLAAAYDLRATLGKNHLITVISNSDTFQFVSSNPWVAVGWRSRQDTTFELAPYLAKKHIAFIPVAAQEIKSDQSGHSGGWPGAGLRLPGHRHRPQTGI